ncbi:MAG: tRNA (adenosine(37)-N6)-threonylcarbamoyltransferase complex ATPase subunit type 1 TsaE [Deltaproteobacteria bacterium]|nr:tRNA (adenosine(37)-N6)-threonylcarbamoyltransferase complex ATPase subunit type 1 TsaE [Deltaproteobacteria bacterium]
MTVKITLSTLTDTATLGLILAQIYSATDLPPPLLLQGDLGTGKTTLVRYLVNALPDGRPEDGVEVCSPSFTLCNSYSCIPQVLHFDLYRLAEGALDDNFDEAVEMSAEGTLLLIVEWPERINKNSLPKEFILAELTGSGNTRQIIFSSQFRIKSSEKSCDQFLETLVAAVKREKLPVIVRNI